jgi:hypothetical protein
MFYYVTSGRTYVTHDRTLEAILTADCGKCEQYLVLKAIWRYVVLLHGLQKICKTSSKDSQNTAIANAPCSHKYYKELVH